MISNLKSKIEQLENHLCDNALQLETQEMIVRSIIQLEWQVEVLGGVTG